MEDAVVVEHHELAFFQEELQLEAFVFEQADEMFASAVVGERLFVRQGGGQEIDFRVVADAVDVSDAVERDEGTAVDEFGVLVDEAVSQGDGCQQLEAFGVLFAHDVGDFDRVDEGRESAGGFVDEAMEDLDARHGVSIGVVGVWEERARGVCEVVAVGSRVDFKVCAEVGVSHEAELGGDLQDRVFCGGGIGDDEKAVGEKLFECFEHGVVIVEGVPRGGGFGVEGGVP